MYYVYILENRKGRFYIGHTNSLERRLDRHNDRTSRVPSEPLTYTHKHSPWEMVWTEGHTTRSSAMQREKQIKAHSHPTGCGETPFRAGLKKGGRRRIPTKESAV